MKITTREYLLKIKRLEKEAIDKLSSGKNVIYALKFKKNIKTKTLLYARLNPVLSKSYSYGKIFGKAIVKKLKEIEKKIDKKDIYKYKIEDNTKIRPKRYRLTRATTFDLMISEIDIERTRFLDLYNLKVDAYLKDGLSENRSRANLEISKLEYEFINKVRSSIANTVYLFAQIGQIDSLKEGLK